LSWKGGQEKALRLSVTSEGSSGIRRKFSEFWKTVLFADESKYEYLDQMDIIVCGENPVKNFEKKNLLPSANHGGGILAASVGEIFVLSKAA